MLSKYLNMTIGDMQVHVQNPEEVPVSINYSLEDPDNFQKKKSADAIGLKIPALLVNEKAANTYRNPDVTDLTSDQAYSGNQKVVVEANGCELLVGKAFLKGGVHNDRPKEYEFDLYGDNADWLIDLQEKTLFDSIKHISFTFNKATVMNSWTFDGTDENLPYVFAPVRYRDPFGGFRLDPNNIMEPVDDNVLPEYLRPALSQYWLLYWAFKSVGYKIQSEFMDSDYFRRQVMPWSWGNFLDSEGTRLTTHKFLAKSTGDKYFTVGRGSSFNAYVDLDVSNDSNNGAYDNNDDYSFTPAYEMRWEYKPPHYGILDATFSCSIYYSGSLSGGNSDANMRLQWFKNGVMVQDDIVFSEGGRSTSTNRFSDLLEFFCTQSVNPGDVITVKVWLRIYRDKTPSNVAHVTANIQQFTLEYFKIPVGGNIDFSNYTGFQKYKVLDFFRGVVDNFNLSFNTDSINKVVVIEPTHPYQINDAAPVLDGYFKDDFVEWNGKADLSKEWIMDRYSDFDREMIIKFKEDSNDGLLKTIQDRNITKLAQAKYVFPARFKTGKKEVENRFFSPVMHYEAEQWKNITGEAPQLIALIPENISNTSRSEASNTFVPKCAYYKGVVAGVGGWKFDGDELATIPFMFAVNYKDGGENDPVLSYSDERIRSGAGFVLAKGLMKRFYMQRLAIIRNGQWYNAWFRLKMVDVASQLHREYKSYRGHRWELIQIKDFKPLIEGSTSCLMRKWAPVEQHDHASSYPGSDSVLSGAPNVADSFDMKYAQLMCLSSDIPKSIE